MLRIVKRTRELKPAKGSIPILPPSPSIATTEPEMPCDSDNLNRRPIAKVQSSNAMFDPNSASPSSEFMNVLKLRMSVYYEQDSRKLVTK